MTETSPYYRVENGHVLIPEAEFGNALFPEIMKSELHGIRSVVEAYSKSAVIGGLTEASACGYAINRGMSDVRLRAQIAGVWTDYRIDRWD